MLLAEDGSEDEVGVLIEFWLLRASGMAGMVEFSESMTAPRLSPEAGNISSVIVKTTILRYWSSHLGDYWIAP